MGSTAGLENRLRAGCNPPEMLYDVAHNIARVETHEIDGVKQKVVLHRKGATRALEAWHAEIPCTHKPYGQAVLIPGSMDTSACVLAGASECPNIAYGSCCHETDRRASSKKGFERNTGYSLPRAFLIPLHFLWTG